MMIALTLVCVALSFTGIGLRFALLAETKLEEHTEISLRGETNTTLSAELSGFYPGSEQEYEIALTGEGAGDYYVSLNFRADARSGGLEEYLNVRILAGDFTTEKNLKELLDGEALDLGRGAEEIRLVYAMPANTGNEAQGTVTEFLIDVIASNAER